jgi:NAD(P)-dependent dehydrogenase (short-subunit alcohol dehydrogenase family)
MREFELNGKVVLVTGGAQGVGRGVAERFLEAGAEVVVCGKKRPAERIEASGREAVFMTCDIREHSAVLTLFAGIGHRFGCLDVLVNNAGESLPADAATASPRFARAVVELNLTAPLNLAQIANEIMQSQAAGGAMINISNLSGVRPSPGAAIYGAAQAGLIHLSRSLAIEWAPKVRVNNVIVGPAEGSGLEANVGSVARLGRTALPRDVGGCCLFLASPLAAHITGVSVEVHGGGYL